MEPIKVSPREVLDMLNSLETNKSCGSDEIPPKILKLTALLIYEPLTKLFNAILFYYLKENLKNFKLSVIFHSSFFRFFI